jgi:RNA polymerase sigma-70 factor (ECF subfamily)
VNWQIGNVKGITVDTSSSDSEIIARAQAGDLRAFETLYRKHEHQVYRTALAILGESQAAEEVLQDCFLRAYKHLQRLNGEPSVSPWLHRVAVNLCYSRLRRNYLAQLTVSLESLSNHPFPSHSPSPEDSTQYNEIQATVQRGIAALGFKHRSVIVLYYLQGFSLEEIAYILDCPVGTVKSRLHHARKELSQRLTSLRPQLAYEAA